MIEKNSYFLFFESIMKNTNDYFLFNFDKILYYVKRYPENEK